MSHEKDADYVKRARSGPRLNGMYETFGSLAAGNSGQPSKSKPTADRALLGDDTVALRILDAYQELSGTFSAHAIASMPYVLEEDCRFAAALLRYAKSSPTTLGPLAVWAMGAAEGCMARALVSVADGEIATLSCSPNPENRTQFYERGAPGGASFFLGSFLDVTPHMLQEFTQYEAFAQGFDVIFEDTTFQMYGSERTEPIRHTCGNLRDNGILVLFEKLLHPDRNEYLRRENQKDTRFKSRYFENREIENKQDTVLNTMEEGQVTLDELIAALRGEFTAAVLTWNSGNFYTVAASDSRENLTRLVRSMSPPAIPDEYRYETLPRPLFGLDKLEFRAS